MGAGHALISSPNHLRARARVMRSEAAPALVRSSQVSPRASSLRTWGRLAGRRRHVAAGSTKRARSRARRYPPPLCAVCASTRSASASVRDRSGHHAPVSRCAKDREHAAAYRHEPAPPWPTQRTCRGRDVPPQPTSSPSVSEASSSGFSASPGARGDAAVAFGERPMSRARTRSFSRWRRRISTSRSVLPVKRVPRPTICV